MIFTDRGYIGCFEMQDRESGKRQLEEYVCQLRNAGHKRIIAPINGDTWHTYRLVSWTDNEPPFPMEPQNPLWYNEVYGELGFKPFKKYRSDVFNMENVEPLPFSGMDLKLRNFINGDLEIIYNISLKGFEDNFLYNDISFEEFHKLYQPILPMIDKDLVVIAEANNVPAGFIFSFTAGNILILKTVAVLPEYRSKGIAAKMVNHVLLQGKQKGLQSAIAALVIDGNNSHKIVSKYGCRKIREYTLYYLDL